MKFNEKLMELRKKEGLSQEELGYKLNVTRQTVSKWELGQTTPEMDKLVEMSKLFGITVDDLINESEVDTNSNLTQNPIIEDRPIENKGSKKDKVGIILVGALVVVIIVIIVKMFTGFGSTNKKTDDEQNIIERFFGIFDRILNMQEDMMGDTTSNINVSRFNGSLELYKGSNIGVSLKRLLDEVITSNKKEERKVTVKYQETETQDPEEIKDLKTNFDDFDEFEISFEYDEEGYIYEVKIEKAVSEISVTRFNSTLELYSGSEAGSSVKNLLDKVITINKTEERKVIVKYQETETQDPEKIQELKTSFDDLKNFEVSFEYDEEGYIYEVKIKRVVTQFEKTQFNTTFEHLYSGTQNGMIVKTALDEIITNNKTDERKITVKYGNTETQNEDEIRSMKQNMGTFEQFEISYEYDVDGFINKAIIEKL